ncbi:copper homeostasis protein CutC [uncultured Microbacterium sp.]|uniref:copper homeostasis protein CutC n=1 Tax=uncultured Microbacterium sp. TaxID=191216 RepID=UPI002604326D|nr:copper homeostasis protein CutC [uncultured Microbacterium sp.]
MVIVRLPFELAVQNIAGVRIAREVGAARVELAQALTLGGLTPSRGMLESVLEAAGDAGPEVHVLVRPRAGGFHYGSDALEVMVRDVRDALSAGAHGVVVGCQQADGTLDRDGLARLVDAANGASVTLHRVIDTTPDPVASLRTARELGLRRVLTSGGASRAIDGVAVLRVLVEEAAGGIEVMAGSGIDEHSVAAIAASGVDAVHFSAKRIVLASAMGASVRMGSAGDGVGGYEVTDRDTALAIIAALHGAVTAA